MFFLEAIRRIQEQRGNGYSANVNDGFMKTVLIMMIPIQVANAFCQSCFFPIPLFICQYLLYVNIVCIVHKVVMKLYW